MFQINLRINYSTLRKYYEKKKWTPSDPSYLIYLSMQRWRCKNNKTSILNVTKSMLIEFCITEIQKKNKIENFHFWINQWNPCYFSLCRQMNSNNYHSSKINLFRHLSYRIKSGLFIHRHDVIYLRNQTVCFSFVLWISKYFNIDFRRADLSFICW
jgi:hypothetical protein